MAEKLKLSIDVEVSVPRVPNFISINGDWKPLSMLTEEQLEAVGRKWTERLIKRAHEQAEEATP